MHAGEDKVVFDGRFIQVIARPFTTRSGRRGVWEFPRRKIFGRVVSIFALTDDNSVILEKHFRVNMGKVGCYVIELPGGLMDKEGEDEQAAIERELLEETGYTVRHIEKVVLHPLNARMFNDTLQLYFGSGAHKVQEPRLDDAEEIEVFTVPLPKLLEFLERLPSDTPIDPKITACLPFLRKRGHIHDYLPQGDAER